ncbi:MAG: carboxypeptidase-like regulatory domain-containing protein [Candidatus Nealsonbacteria bacterium]|nr:carboxypeptidase-like regulatory domain-containing protein [Candidatus Nealsonbacteria bacterium]
MNKIKFRKNKGISLIDVLVGTSLLVVVFLGIFGSYELLLKTLNQNQIRIVATAVASQQIEMIKNLSYESVGIRGGFPEGDLEASTTTVRNNINFTIERRVDYVVDPADGISSPDDSCPNDYKKAEIKVSWKGTLGGQIKFFTDIAPKNIAQECANSGGILSVSVFDAFGVMVPFPLIEVKDPTTGQTLKTFTPASGQQYISLATSTYKIVVSKDGYSADRTYGIDEIATPQKPHSMILEGQLTEISFSIDKLSSFAIDTFSLWGSDNFFDSFLNENKISEKSDLFIDRGEIVLASSSDGYLSSGYLISSIISPINLVSWENFSFSDSEPTDTDLKYQFYYASGTGWYLIPNSDLSGNSVGFDVSPVSLSGLSTTTHSQLEIKGNFSSGATSSTSALYDWQVSWITEEASPIPNANFNLRGEKFIGKNAQENKVYKYSISTTTNSSGHKEISGLEWDSYSFSINPASGLDLVEINPSSQPIGLPPDTTSSVRLYLDSQNSLLLILKDADTLEPLFAAKVRAYNIGLGYDNVQYTNEKGQTYFIPLENASYKLDIEIPSYQAISATTFVSGDVIKTIKLVPED